MPVEVELAVKSTARLDAILEMYAGWAQAGKSVGVMYVCESVSLAEKIKARALHSPLNSHKQLRVELLETIKAQALEAWPAARARCLERPRSKEAISKLVQERGPAQAAERARREAEAAERARQAAEQTRKAREARQATEEAWQARCAAEQAERQARREQWERENPDWRQQLGIGTGAEQPTRRGLFKRRQSSAI